MAQDSEVDMTDSSSRLTPDELRALFLFESIDDSQLELLAEKGQVETRAAGSAVYTEGQPATCFFVLLHGTIALSRRVHGDDFEVSRTEQRGAYGGATQAFIDRIDQVYLNSMHAITDVEVYQLPAEVIAYAVRTWFPMAMHLLEGLFFGMRSMQTVVGERERLLGRGAMSAGLSHELNKPPAAAA